MKRILIVMNTMGLAGAERALLSMLKEFDYSKVQVSLLAIIDRGELFKELPPQVEIINKNPSHGPVTGRAARLYILRKLVRAFFSGGYCVRHFPYIIKNLLGQLRRGHLMPDKLFWHMLASVTPPPREAYDLAIAYIEGAATYYVADKVRADKKVAFVHVNYEKAGYIPKLDRPYYEKMDYIFSVSESVKKAFGAVYPQFSDKLRLFYNIVKPEGILEKAQQDGGFDDDFSGLRILTIGRLHEQKGLDVAIDALAKLREMGYNEVRWYVLGEGVLRQKLTKQIYKRKLQNQFFLLGTRSNPYPYIKQCDVYAQPSRFEGMGIALLEAVFLGKPVITTDFDGVPDLLTHGENGIIFRLSRDNLVAAIQELIDHPQKRAALAGGAAAFRFDCAGDAEIFYAIASGKDV